MPGTSRSAWQIRVCAAVALALCAAPAGAAATLHAPAGTHVGLEFLTPVDTTRNRPGDKVSFKVVADVVIDRYVVIKRNAPLTGMVTLVQPPARRGFGAKMVIGYLSVTPVDKKPVSLTDITISPNNTAKRTRALAATTAAVLLTQSAWGLLGGAVVKGDNVQVPAGAVVGSATKAATTVTLP
jgi:hypothetical protein